MIHKLQYINIQNTTRCNAHCTICPHNQIYKNDQYDMSQEVWDKILNDLKQMKYDGYVSFVLNCEPLMDKNIFKKIEDLKSNEIKTHLFTNASLLNIHTITRLIDLKIDMVTMSLLSVNKEKYEQITGLSFHNTMTNIMKASVLFNKYNIFYLINAAIADMKEIEEYKNIFINELFFKKIHFNLRDSRAGFFNNIQANKENWCFNELNKGLNYCIQPTHTLPILANGDVRFCSLDWTGETKIDNVLNNSIETIFDSHAMVCGAYNLKHNRFDFNCCKKCYKEIGLGE